MLVFYCNMYRCLSIASRSVHVHLCFAHGYEWWLDEHVLQRGALFTFSVSFRPAAASETSRLAEILPEKVNKT